MDDDGFIDITSDGLKEYLATHRETDYLLVDVRQPLEYELGHIPGAAFLPLSDLETHLFDLPADKELIFYCRTGSRSMVAASLASEGEVTAKPVYNLFGGMISFQGKTLTGIPRVQVFDKAQSLDALLYTAMNLEKGAWRFYNHLKNRYVDEPIGPTLAALSKAENAHARLIYHFWKKTAAAPPPFETLFEKLAGEILEGGDTLENGLRQITEAGPSPCLGVIEIALHMEYSAYDLYRTMAGQTDSNPAREALLSIAQAEKRHMRTLANAIAHCPET